MIVEFSVKNFRSIKDLQTISFAATKLSSNQEKYPDLDKKNIAEEEQTQLLKTIGIYGSNASGKSNIIRALEYFIQAIRNEASTESKLNSLCDPFLYQENAIDSESYFQIVFILNDVKYRYGFTVKKNTSKKEKESKEIITNEWLYGRGDKKMKEFFIRTGLEVKKDKFPNKEKIPPLQYDHTLFITHAAAFDRGGICVLIKDFFNGKTISNFTNGYDSFRWNTLHLIEFEKRKVDFLDLLASFNLRYSDVIIERDHESKDQLNVPINKIFFTKNFTNAKNKNLDIKLNLANNESEGTQKLFDIAGTLIRGFNMPSGGFMIIDEIDSNFHPALLIKMIALFNDPAVNVNNTQLLFTSHDTNLMSPSIMRRDQFFFTEKDESEATRLYSLADLKGIRNDADFAKQYLAGFFGAVPVLDTYSNKHFEQNARTLEP